MFEIDEKKDEKSEKFLKKIIKDLKYKKLKIRDLNNKSRPKGTKNVWTSIEISKRNGKYAIKKIESQMAR